MAKATIGKNKDGYGYKYADMAKVHVYIDSIHGKYYQYTKTDETDHNTYVWTHRFPDDVVPEELDIRGAMVVNATLSNGKQNPAQAHGSALTYARRYSLYMVYGIAVDDNDAEDLTIVQSAQDQGYIAQQAPVMTTPLTWRQRLIAYANSHGIALPDVAAQYDLKPGSPDEVYQAALEQMQKDIEG